MRSSSAENITPRHTASQPKEWLLALLSLFERALGSIPFWWSICLGSAGILAVSARHAMNADGLSYLDLASEGVRSGPSGLLNGYWSPGYPALISLALAMFRPSPAQEFPLVHFVNFFIFVLTLWAFDFFLRHWLLSHANGAIGDQEKKDFVPFAFCTFLWFTLECIGVAGVSPDLCVAAIVFLAAGITCRLSLPGSSWKHYVALGFALGLGYYAKAAMFPLGLLFLCVLLLYPPSPGVPRQRQRLLLSLSVFLLMAAPLVTVLSGRVGRLSFGETGRLNYAWYVKGLQRYTGWTGGSPDVFGSPEHPPRKLMEEPLVLEFDSPIKGTYPLWYDPSYWYAGAKVRFNLRQQIAALMGTSQEYMAIFVQTAVFFSGAAVLCILIAYENRLSKLPLRESWLLTWPLAAMSMYALVHVEIRFLAAFFVLLWLAIYGALMFRLNRGVAMALCATVAGTVMILFMIDLVAESARTVKDLVQSRPPDYQTVAAGLRNLGVQRGDRLAVVGFENAFEPYYARYAGLRVVAEIPSTDEFFNLTTPELKSVEERLAEIGVKAVVAKNNSALRNPNWRDVKVSDSVHFSVLKIR
jgi:hypothetical protein